MPIIRRHKLNLYQTVLCGFFLSFVIEFLQFMLGTGVSELDDLILNTVGALIGFIIYQKVKKKLRRG